MKNNEDEPKEYFERNIPLILALAGLGIFLDWLTIYLLKNINPWGTLVGIPGLVLTLQALWLIVNPYAVVYADRFEIKQSLFYNKQFYFLDIKAVQFNAGKLKLVYNDGDPEALPLLGIRSSNKPKFEQALSQKVQESLASRNF